MLLVNHCPNFVVHMAAAKLAVGINGQIVRAKEQTPDFVSLLFFLVSLINMSVN